MNANDYYLDQMLKQSQEEEVEQSYKDYHAAEFIKKMEEGGEAFGYTFKEDVVAELEDCDDYPDILLELRMTGEMDGINELIDEKVRIVAYKYAEDQYVSNILLAGDF